MSIWAGIWLESNANIALLRGNVGPYQLRILLDYKIGPMSQKDRNPKIRFDPDLPTLDQCRLGLELDIRTQCSMCDDVYRDFRVSVLFVPLSEARRE